MNASSPLQEIHLHSFSLQGVRFFVKRDDLLHPHISGNKWRKLKHNLLKARELSCLKLLTSGGAYSNHLAAVAATGREYGFATEGIVRGEQALPLNPTLRFAEGCGMVLRHVGRAIFKEKTQLEIAAQLGLDLTQTYLLPEGGSNELALPGVAEVVAEIELELGSVPDFIASACGTGATLAGLALGLDGRGVALGVPVLKGGFMEKEVARLLSQTGFSRRDSFGENLSGFLLMDGYHFGGYAKFSPALVGFINRFKAETGIPLDPVYTGKLAFALVDLAEKGYFQKGQTVVMLHTGGLQGVAGFNERFGNLLR